MAEAVYLLCALTSMFCTILLFRSYRERPSRLLMWSTLCFVGFALNNILLVIDLVLVPAFDLALARSGTALIAIALLVIGLGLEDS